jgi:tryptophan synthase alpha chain
VAAVETALGQARAAGRPSLVAYVTGGIRADWTDLLTAMIEAGADAVEIGLPFSDPMLDGYTIQQASNAAISRGATMAGILGQLSEAATAAAAASVPLIAMTYANHAYCRGLPAFCRQLADAGLSGVIIPDLPAAEAGDYLEAAVQAGLDPTLMVTPATGPEQIKAIACRTRGFLYVMSVMATTGTSRESDDTGRWAVAARARRSAARGLASAGRTAGLVQTNSPRPVLIGFGIDTPSRAAAAARHADGVIVASALMRRVLDGASSADIGRDVAALRAALDQARP